MYFDSKILDQFFPGTVYIEVDCCIVILLKTGTRFVRTSYSFILDIISIQCILNDSQ